MHEKVDFLEDPERPQKTPQKKTPQDPINTMDETLRRWLPMMLEAMAAAAAATARVWAGAGPGDAVGRSGCIQRHCGACSL